MPNALERILGPNGIPLAQPATRHAGHLGPGKGGRLVLAETGSINVPAVGITFTVEPGAYLIVPEVDFERMVAANAAELVKAGGVQ